MYHVETHEEDDYPHKVVKYSVGDYEVIAGFKLLINATHYCQFLNLAGEIVKS